MAADDEDKPFRLLRLPSLVSSRIVKQLTLLELFKLSLTTMKTRNVIKSSFPKHQFHIKLDLSCELIMKLKNEHNGSVLQIEGYDDSKKKNEKNRKVVILRQFKVETGKIKIYSGQNGNIEFSWSNITDVKVTRCFIHQFVNSFNYPYISFGFYRGVNCESILKVMKYARRQNLDVRNVCLDIPSSSLEAYKYFLDTCPEINKLQITPTLNGEIFEYNPSTDQTFKLNRLRIHDAYWLKLEDFMQCKRIELCDNDDKFPTPYMKAPYLNGFLKKWITSKSRIEYVSIVRLKSELDFLVVVEGLTSPENKIEQYADEQHLKIQHKDGKKAVVTYSKNINSFYLKAGNS